MLGCTDRMVDYAPLLGIRPSLEQFIQFWTHCMGKTAANSAERQRDGGEVQLLPCEERLRDWDLFNLRKTWFQGSLPILMRRSSRRQLAF